MPGYIPMEYPKWVDGVVVQNAAEERAHWAALKDTAPPGTVQAVHSPPAKTAEMSLGEALSIALAKRRAAPAEPAEAVCAPELIQAPSPSAERMRRARKRRRNGLRVIPFEIRDAEVSGLITRGLLEDVARNDPSEIARALGELFDAVPPERWPAGNKR
jgi:hypothetical protein